VVKTCIALIAALLYSTAVNVYWIRAYYGKSPFHIKIECNEKR
jgi:hypothetical protein